MDEFKQVILIRADLKLPKGKMSAQAAHASVEAVLKQLKKDKDKVKNWRDSGSKKVVLKVACEKDLLKYNQIAKDLGIAVSLITDAGKTVIAPGTRTACAIGPDTEETIDKICKELTMM